MHQNTNKSQISILNDQNIPKSYITAIPFHGATFCDTIGKTITGFIVWNFEFGSSGFVYALFFGAREVF